jgi:thiamine biosynthesis lipoprotein
MIKKTKLYMDTVVEIKVVCANLSKNAEQKIDRAFDAFRRVEDACSRFSPDSELMQACMQVHKPVAVSPFLFEPLKFALEIAKLTDGIFDPTVGRLMEEHGFNRHYLTGQTTNSAFGDMATYRDITLNEQDRTLLLQKPLVIDLGAVAKGFAIDLAANELKEFDGFVVNAGGDLFAGGVDQSGNPWKIGIQHPVQKDQIIQTIEISNEAICTSGSYERKSEKITDIHHLINPKTKKSPNDWISCSVIAPFAMMADAFSTVSFLLGIEKGKALIQHEQMKAILITSLLEIEKVGI